MRRKEQVFGKPPQGKGGSYGEKRFEYTPGGYVNLWRWATTSEGRKANKAREVTR